MLSFVIVVILVFGVNTLLWTTAGGLRVVAAWVARLRSTPEREDARREATPGRDRVAILIAAHNEEFVIGHTLEALEGVGDDIAVFLVSDGSSDATADIARSHGATVLELNPNRGKAGAIVEAVRHFEIADRFEVLLLLDADTRLSKDYFDTGLGEFADPGIVAVAGRASTLFNPRSPTRIGRILVAYRERVYIAMQYLFKFGQASKHANVVPIVPGFASMYRTRILADIDIAAPGLKIEDYNMTFELHAKKLGRISFHPHVAIALTQDPDTFADYAKQVERWNTGFWQTVVRHRFRFRLFWFVLTLFIAELVMASVVLISLVPSIVLSLYASAVVALGWDPTGTAAEITTLLPPLALVLGVVLPDYLLTLMAAVVARRPVYLLYGLCFPILRVIDAVLCAMALAVALTGRTSGTWTSPSRRAIRSEPGGAEVTVTEGSAPKETVAAVS